VKTDRDTTSKKLSERAYLSVAGKAIIGLVGGVILLPIMIYRSCEPKYVRPQQDIWVEKLVVDSFKILAPAQRPVYLVSLGINPGNADSLALLLGNRISGFNYAKPFNQIDLERIDSTTHERINAYRADTSYKLYTFTTDSSKMNFIVAIKDSFVRDVVFNIP
jgi:hypothetical protein